MANRPKYDFININHYPSFSKFIYFPKQIFLFHYCVTWGRLRRFPIHYFTAQGFKPKEALLCRQLEKWEKVLAATDHTTTQFLLDPTSHNLVPEMRVCVKDKSDVCLMFYVTRLWCYSIDCARRTILRSKGVLR